MKVRYTNFDGDWDAPCTYCGKPHRSHQIYIGEAEGYQLIHRNPCPEQQYAIKKHAVVQGIALRTVLWFYNVGCYIWSKVPLKKEFGLLFAFLKNIYLTVRALIHLRKSKPK
jgi:hypothetical protein